MPLLRGHVDGDGGGNSKKNNNIHTQNNCGARQNVMSDK